MAWFKSRRTPGGDQQMDYLNATDTTVRPLALPSLLVALLLVSAIAFLLFVIGRWGYQEISKNDAPTSSEVATTDPNAPADNPDAANGSSDTDSNQGSGTTDGQSGSTDSGTNSTSGSGTGGAGNTSTDTSDSTTTSTNTSSTGSNGSSTAQSESIPNTGPSSLIGIFIVTVVLSSIGYYAVTIRSLQRSS